ncbi:hypothetical protein MK376_00235, partial [Streptococcus pyogenes]|nr:hypothetical protein [Streptococcus pyogenes]
FFPPIVTGSV